MPDALTPFEGMDIRSLIDAQAERRGDHPFLIWEPFEGEGLTWSYAAFAGKVRRFAAGLQARGVAPGERVIVHMNNCADQVLAWLGSAYAGAVPVTTNAASIGEDLEYFATHSRARLALTQPEFLPLFRDEVPAVTALYCGGEVADLPAGVMPLSVIDADPATLAERPHLPLAPFGVQYTSGTTSRPKAVLWTHANALWGGRLSAAHEDLRPEDVQLVTLPLFHTNAQVYSMLATLWVGATAVLQPKFSASRFWDVSLKHGCTFTSIIPFVPRSIMDQPTPAESRYRIWGSPICDAPFDARFGVKSVGWWGMTETITHPIVGSPHHADAPLSMGRPAPGYGIYVLDEDMVPVKPGEVGDLYIRGVRGVSIFAEYAGDPDATANAFTSDGLFITGDRARLGENGYLYFADRSKDMLKVSGENVAASEVERVILETGLVAECAVVAKPDPMRGELPAAFVVRAAGAEGDIVEPILASCRKRLAHFKVPVEVRLVDELPRATLNKVAKNELRKLLQAEAANR